MYISETCELSMAQSFCKAENNRRLLAAHAYFNSFRPMRVICCSSVTSLGRESSRRVMTAFLKEVSLSSFGKGRYLELVRCLIKLWGFCFPLTVRCCCKFEQ